MSEKKIILILDDNETTRMLVKYIVQPMGYEAVEVSNGLDGLEKIEELEVLGRAPVMIITDLEMPIMDGFEFINTVRTFDLETPILCLTAQSSQDVRQEGKIKGADGWIVKPFVAVSLQKLIEKVL